ncbi:MAG TPA: GH116 family glycosyl hydrolase [Bacteroidales bacterium]|nr:GH116 family glycosyl hydrolase [Bacteroidales bacterium]
MMKNGKILQIGIAFLGALIIFSCSSRNGGTDCSKHAFNWDYTGKYLDRVAFPIGGIGAGMFCMDGTGSLSHLSINNKPEMFNEPYAFAALSVKGYPNAAKVLEAQVPEWKMFGMAGSGNGGAGRNYGYPRFKNGRFLPRFPFATLILEDKDIPMAVEVTGWSPFIPGDNDNSSLPAGAMEYKFTNTSTADLEAVFSWNSRNIISERTGRILGMKNGFILTGEAKEGTIPGTSGYAVSVNENNAVIDHCWFRGSWFDPAMILWKNIENSNMVSNAPVDNSAPGASIYVPVKLKAGETKTIKVRFSWYMPDTKLSIGITAKPGQQAPVYKPWYASRFSSLSEATDYWNQNYDDLRHKSELFRDAFFSSTLPPEVLEAVAANLTIIKSPTVLRQDDGRLWAWEGCGDNSGCCHGTCTHVWNYAQAIPHLFPALERTLRETEFMVSQDERGHQTFRANMPISEPAHNFYAASDGQLGGIMKVYREWRISGNTEWMKSLYPMVKKSLDYCIETWDPGHKGYLEEPHHNTYDIEFWGPDGMCTSFYLGALTSFIEMSKAADSSFEEYENLLKKGKSFMESDLYDGEYFIQKVVWEGLRAQSPVEVAKTSLNIGYSDEALELMEQEGPKYQYGKGCLSDGVLGMWMADVCGLREAVDNEKVKSHLVAIHKYNLRKVLYDHSNPQRPTYAAGKDGGLLLCTWPKEGKLSLPFVYSNEVWTGIEYQVASHLMLMGEVEKGLEIVRICRERYDGSVRNPFNEYECGNWYARAMSSYAMLEGLTGARYDAVDGTLYINSKIGDFTSFISTETGFGNVGLKEGKPFLKVVYGKIEPAKVIVSGSEKQLIN